MFVKKSCVDEIASSLEENMSILANQPEQRAKERKEKVITYLTIASDILDQAGLEKESAAVMNVIRKFADKEFGELTIKDPALPNSSEQALKNLKEKGWVFNVSDGHVEHSEVEEPSAEGEEMGEETNTEAPSAEELSELFSNM